MVCSRFANTLIQPQRTTPPFHFSVRVYFDGRTKCETRFVVFLDENHSGYRKGGSGATLVDHRPVPGTDGKLYRYNWMFREAGIGHLLANLSMEDFSSKDESEDLAVVLEGAQLDQEEEKPDFGTIRVTLTRITTHKSQLKSYKPEHREGEDDDVEMTDASNIQHKAM